MYTSRVATLQKAKHYRYCYAMWHHLYLANILSAQDVTKYIDKVVFERIYFGRPMQGWICRHPTEYWLFILYLFNGEVYRISTPDERTKQFIRRWL
jgi:hypothetical protein